MREKAGAESITSRTKAQRAFADRAPRVAYPSRRAHKLGIMEVWGAVLYGDPCRECGFDWSVNPHAAVAQIADLSDQLAAATRTSAGSERRSAGGWSIAEYLCHIGDNLRQWAERVQTARLAAIVEVDGYDPDELAAARRYATIPLATALWSLSLATRDWTEVLELALHESIVLEHRTRGRQRAEDIVRNNYHDAYHHQWDVSQILLEQESPFVLPYRRSASRRCDG